MSNHIHTGVQGNVYNLILLPVTLLILMLLLFLHHPNHPLYVSKLYILFTRSNIHVFVNERLLLREFLPLLRFFEAPLTVFYFVITCYKWSIPLQKCLWLKYKLITESTWVPDYGGGSVYREAVFDCKAVWLVITVWLTSNMCWKSEQPKIKSIFFYICDSI